MTVSSPLLLRTVLPALLLAVSLWLGARSVFASLLNHDVAWLLYLAGKVLQGARLYVDYPEVNPPLIVWLNLPLAYAAQQAGLAPATVLRLAVLALAVASVGWTAAILRRSLGSGPAWCGLLFAAYAAIALPGYDFGQREHLALLLVLPYLGGAVLRLEAELLSCRHAMAAAACAAVGLALKPHFLLVPLLVEGLLLWHGRRLPWRETLLMGALGALYGVLVLWLAPDYLSMLALLSRSYWNYASENWFDFLRVPQCQAAIILVGISWWAPSPHQAVRRVLSAAALGFALAALIQHKAWSYHWYPPMALGWLLFSQAAAAALAQRRAQGVPLSPVLVGSAALLLSAVALWSAPRDSLKLNPYPAQLGPVIRRLGGGPVLMLATPLRVAFPLVTEPGIGSTARFPAMGIALAARQSGDAALEDYLRRTLAEDMRKMPPRLLVVEARPDPEVPGWDYLAFFTQDAALARMLGQFQQVGEVGKFRIFQHKPAGGAK